MLRTVAPLTENTGAYSTFVVVILSSIISFFSVSVFFLLGPVQLSGWVASWVLLSCLARSGWEIASLSSFFLPFFYPPAAWNSDSPGMVCLFCSFSSSCFWRLLSVLRLVDSLEGARACGPNWIVRGIYCIFLVVFARASKKRAHMC